MEPTWGLDRENQNNLLSNDPLKPEQKYAASPNSSPQMVMGWNAWRHVYFLRVKIDEYELMKIITYVIGKPHT